MPANHAAENALGTLGTICWTVQLLPQIWKSYREKSTEGLSELTMFAWGVAGAFLGTYSVVLDLNVPLIMQPQLFGVLCLVSYVQCLYYGRKWSKTGACACLVAILVVFAGFEVGMIYAVKPSFERGDRAPTQFFGIFSAVLIAIALLPQYYEIYKHNEVVGLSVVFMVIDMLGGVFNDLSLVFKDEFDVIAGVTYTVVVVMDGLIIVAAAILNPRANRRRRAAAAALAQSLPADSATAGIPELRNGADPSPSRDEEKDEKEEEVSVTVAMTTRTNSLQAPTELDLEKGVVHGVA